jgi:hypothetical protein
MLTHTAHRVAMAALVFAAPYLSGVLAQQADANGPSNSYAGTYSGRVESGSSLPVEINVEYGNYIVGWEREMALRELALEPIQMVP